MVIKDFALSLNESEALLSALQDYKVDCLSVLNYSRADLVQGLIDKFIHLGI